MGGMFNNKQLLSATAKSADTYTTWRGGDGGGDCRSHHDFQQDAALRLSTPAGQQRDQK